MYIHGYTTYILGRYTWYIHGNTIYIHYIGYPWYIHGYTTYIPCILVRTAYTWNKRGIYQAYAENWGSRWRAGGPATAAARPCAPCCRPAAAQRMQPGGGTAGRATGCCTRASRPSTAAALPNAPRCCPTAQAASESLQVACRRQASSGSRPCSQCNPPPPP